MRRFQFIMIPASLLSLLFGMIFRVGIAPARAQITTDDVVDEAPALQRGVEGSAVRDVQIFLERSDYYSGPIDGIYNSQVERAILDFQRDFDLPPTGVVDEATMDAMSGFENEMDGDISEEDVEINVR